MPAGLRLVASFSRKQCNLIIIHDHIHRRELVREAKARRYEAKKGEFDYLSYVASQHFPGRRSSSYLGSRICSQSWHEICRNNYNYSSPPNKKF